MGRHEQHEALRGQNTASDQGGHVLHVEDQCGRGYGVLRAGPAARRGAACRLCSNVTDPRRTSAADGGPAGGRP